jgi:hypothetical protein
LCAAIVTTLCQYQMTARLRASGSADYPWDLVRGVHNVGGDRYRLQSYVDAQNAFGAKLRTHFACTAEGFATDLNGYEIVEFP